tara:strand:- start:196 stop:351 length:156 start_codon:yes stop_codon:yes gene_type:complete
VSFSELAPFVFYSVVGWHSITSAGKMQTPKNVSHYQPAHIFDIENVLDKWQ